MRQSLGAGYASRMEQLERIADGIYLHARCTIQRSDQPGYEDRWFMFEDVPPGRRWVKHANGSLITFGSVEDAAAWLDANLSDATDAD